LGSASTCNSVNYLSTIKPIKNEKRIRPDCKNNL